MSNSTLTNRTASTSSSSVGSRRDYAPSYPSHPRPFQKGRRKKEKGGEERNKTRIGRLGPKVGAGWAGLPRRTQFPLNCFPCSALDGELEFSRPSPTRQYTRNGGEKDRAKGVGIAEWGLCAQKSNSLGGPTPRTFPE